MSEIVLPEIPEGYRWRFVDFVANHKELRLEKKGRIFWHCVGKALISDFGDLQAAVMRAAQTCLEGRDWRAEAYEYAARAAAKSKRRADQLPNGVVE